MTGRLQRALCFLAVLSSCRISGAATGTGLFESKVEEAIAGESISLPGSDEHLVEEEFVSEQQPISSPQREPAASPLAHTAWKLLSRGTAGFQPLVLGLFKGNDDYAGPYDYQGQSDQEREMLEAQKAAQESAAMVTGLTTVLTILVGIHRYYHPKQWPLTDPSQAHLRDSMNQFSSGLFDCTEDTKTCLFACCCFPVIWADVYSSLGLISFCAGFIFLLAMQVLGGVQALAFISVCASVGVRTKFRQQFRQKFGMPNGTCEDTCGDCLTVCFCACCAVAQESRHCWKAALVGHPALVRSGGAEVPMTHAGPAVPPPDTAFAAAAVAPSAPPHDPYDAYAGQAPVVQDGNQPSGP
mmetsp:Transcript_73947/g.175994  ORF Transcript_73947/g.175994 Transcript_73947/m.175994 type:complete len:355 (+) Transcript_73947:103-1167(+)|eukprot:CAMPEP_0178420528 /NCGR_PEP_ID=MMETSP0689_2-20121128/26179_1 /TAXON_ID=160604 /ORGANISM="Amphidinium massartii, Strain CS-259" /LENGTH=354 /DNA_ID=CAMNT_0020042013 /DNA_START=103 /DNA_END=1167 /DNA_ORIENTATION=-